MNLALNVSMSFDTVNAFSSSYDKREIKAMHRLGTLAHFAPWVLEGLCRSVPGNKAMLTNVVRMLNERTFYMPKPFEAATIRSFLFGQASMGQCSCGAGARATVTRALANLVKHGILVKIECHGCPTMYSLNIPNLIEHIRKMIAATPAENANARVRDMRDRWAEIESEIPLLMNAYARTMALVQSTVESLVHLREKASEILVQAVAAVEQKAEVVVEAAKEVAVAVKEVMVEKVEQAKEVVMNLVDAIKGVVKGSQVKSDKLRAKCDQPLFDKKGRPIGRVALAFWHTKVRDYPEHYGAYYETSTSKMVGQMNNLLNELKAQGKNEDEIRLYLTDLIENWHRPMFDNRQILITIEKNGKPKSWPVQIPEMPEFTFYYPNRAAVSAQVFASINRHVVSSSSGSALTKGFKFC